MRRTMTVAGIAAAALLALTGLASADDYIEECESYRNHSGNVPGYYDYAVFFEQGYEPIEVWTNGEAIFVAPPDGGTWDRVYKCHSDGGTTTTVADSTTTSGGETTTTGAESTTTSVTDSTTTTDPGDPELPFTGGGLTLALPAGLLVAGGVGALIRARREQ